MDLHDAAADGDLARLRSLLAAAPERVDVRDRRGLTALHLAATGEIARLLLAHGADPEARASGSFRGTRPLHRAAARGLDDVVAALLEAGADPLAAEDVASILRDLPHAPDDRGKVPLHWAATAEVVRRLLDAGTPVDVRAGGTTPLHAASYRGRTDAVRALLAAGADVHATDRRGRTPLHEAAEQGHDAAVAVLLAAGADVSSTDAWQGQTPLHGAALRCRDAVIHRLVDAGADLHLRGTDGQTPLHLPTLPETRALALRLASGWPSELPLAAPRGRPVRRLLLGGDEAITVADHGELLRWRLGPSPRVVAGLATRHAWLTGAAWDAPDALLVATAEGVEVRRRGDLRLVRTRFTATTQPALPEPCDTSPDGRWLAFGEDDLGDAAAVRLISRATGAVTLTLEGGESVSAVRFDPTSRRLAVAFALPLREVQLHELTPDGRSARRRNLTNPLATRDIDQIEALAFSPEGQRLAWIERSTGDRAPRPAGWRGDLVALDVASGDARWSRSIDATTTGDPRSLRELRRRGIDGSDVVFAGPDVVAVALPAGLVLLVSAHDGSILRRVQVHPTADVTALAWDPRTGALWAGLATGDLVGVPAP